MEKVITLLNKVSLNSLTKRKCNSVNWKQGNQMPGQFNSTNTIFNIRLMIILLKITPMFRLNRPSPTAKKICNSRNDTVKIAIISTAVAVVQSICLSLKTKRNLFSLTRWFWTIISIQKVLWKTYPNCLQFLSAIKVRVFTPPKISNSNKMSGLALRRFNSLWVESRRRKIWGNP